jgi:hypothetical protein
VLESSDRTQGRLPAGHPTAWIFLDETGVVQQQANDPYFGIGILKLSNPALLLRELQSLRDRHEFREELHWANLDKAGAGRGGQRVPFAERVIDLVLDLPDVQFCCHIADRQHGDLTARFRGHPHAGERAYEAMAAAILGEMIDDREIVSVIADKRSTSPAVRFELDVAKSVNQSKGGLAVANVCRLDSHSTDALQVVDLLLGAAALDLRQGRTESGTQKQQLLTYLLDRCGCPTFRPAGGSDATGKFAVKLLTRSRKARRKRRGG